MSEHLSNDQIVRRITDANSDLKRYLNLAPGLQPTPSQPKKPNEYQCSILPPLFPKPTLRP